MAHDDAMHNSKSNAGPGKILARVQALKNAEEFVRVTHVEAGAIILDSKDCLAMVHMAADGNPWHRALRAVLQCVADEIAPDLPNQNGIGFYGRQLSNFDQRQGAYVQGFYLGSSGLGQQRHIDTIEFQCGPADTREFEKTHDQLVHLLTACANHADDAPAFRAELLREFAFENARESVHGTQRRPQIV